MRDTLIGWDVHIFQFLICLARILHRFLSHYVYMLICNNFVTCIFLNLINISLKSCRKGDVVTAHIENVYLWLHVGDKRNWTIMIITWLLHASESNTCKDSNINIKTVNWWRQYAPLKYRSTSTWLHDSKSQKTILNFILAAVQQHWCPS
jgi:hypothetical protein